MTAPILGTPVLDKAGRTTIYSHIPSDTNTGTCFVVASELTTAPDSTQMADGEDALGFAAPSNPFTVTDFAPAPIIVNGIHGSRYFLYYMHRNVGLEDSDIIQLGPFDMDGRDDLTKDQIHDDFGTINLHIDASDRVGWVYTGGGTGVDGDTVSTVGDSSGNGRTTGEAVLAKRAILKTNRYKGLPALVFAKDGSGGTDYPAMTVQDPFGDETYYVVYRMAADAIFNKHHGFFLSQRNSSNSRNYIARAFNRQGGSDVLSWFSTKNIWTDTDYVPGNSVMTIVSYRVGNSVPDRMSMFINGKEQTLQNPPGTSVDSASGFTEFILGKTGSDQNCSLDLFEIIGYVGAHNDEQQALIMASLLDTYEVEAKPFPAEPITTGFGLNVSSAYLFNDDGSLLKDSSGNGLDGILFDSIPAIAGMEDDFTDTNGVKLVDHKPDADQVWFLNEIDSGAGSNFTIQTNQLQIAASIEMYAFRDDSSTGWSQLVLVGGVAKFGVGPSIFMNSGGKGISAAFTQESGGNYTHLQFYVDGATSGSEIQLSASNPNLPAVPVASDTLLQLQFRSFTGSDVNLCLTINESRFGDVIHTVTSSALTVGRDGIYNDGTHGSAILIDDFTSFKTRRYDHVSDNIQGIATDGVTEWVSITQGIYDGTQFLDTTLGTGPIIGTPNHCGDIDYHKQGTGGNKTYIYAPIADFPGLNPFEAQITIIDPVTLTTSFSFATIRNTTSTAITSDGSGTATVTTLVDHEIPDGAVVVCTGWGQAAYNITATITKVSDLIFTYPISGTPTTPGTGTGSYNFGGPVEPSAAWAEDATEGRTGVDIYIASYNPSTSNALIRPQDGVYLYNWDPDAGTPEDTFRFIEQVQFTFNPFWVQGLTRDANGNWYFAVWNIEEQSRNYVFVFNSDKKLINGAYVPKSLVDEIEGLFVAGSDLLISYRQPSNGPSRYDNYDLAQFFASVNPPREGDTLNFDKNRADNPWTAFLPIKLPSEGTIIQKVTPHSAIQNDDNFMWHGINDTIAGNFWRSWLNDTQGSIEAGVVNFELADPITGIFTSGRSDFIFHMTWSEEDEIIQFYANGVLVGEDVTSPNFIEHFGGIFLGGLDEAGNFNDTLHDYFVTLDVRMTAADVAINVNDGVPLQLFQVKDEERVVLSGQSIEVQQGTLANVGVSIAGETGAYAYAGEDIKFNHAFLANTGAYAYTGLDASLERGVILNAEGGSYAYAGFTVLTPVVRYISGATGSYSYDGQDIAFGRNRVIFGEIGAYSYGGPDAQLSRQLIEEFDAGSYSYTGFTADIFRVVTVEIDSGNYAYSGDAVEFTLVRFLEAEAGAYSYTGAAADLITDGVLQVDAGSYAYSGQDVVLRPIKLIFPDAGSYGYNGFSVAFIRDEVLAAEIGTYSYNGVTVELQLDLVEIVATGAYAYTGFDAALDKVIFVEAESGRYNYTGAQVDLRRSKVNLQVDIGAYAYTGFEVNKPTPDIFITLFSEIDDSDIFLYSLINDRIVLFSEIT